MNGNELYQKAKEVMPGGVNSSTRLNKALGMPLYVSKGKGSKLWDMEGREYLDMSCAHGAGLLGNGHPAIDEALRKAIEIGYVNSFETEYHEKLARIITESIPCADKIRFCSAGSEATMHLIRACRGFTGKNKIIRVEGHFHGYHELIFIGGQPPASEFPRNRQRPYIESVGIPEEFANLIIPVPCNDIAALQEAVDKHGSDTALLILEPINFNTAGIRAQQDYLEFARKITKEHGIVLFFDEIQSAFKKSFGCAQSHLGVTPDVCTIGKSIGGGLPLSAFCGKAEIMDTYQPVGPVQHSGTFNAHLIPILAGLAFVQEAAKPEFYPKLQALEKQFHEGVDAIIQKHDLNMIVPHFGARYNILLGRKTPALKYEETFCHKKDVMLKILKACFDKGVYFHDYGGGPSHNGYSIQHTTEDIAKVLGVLEEVLVAHRNEM